MKIQFETFREMGNYEVSTLKQDAPSSFNGIVRVKKYLVTVEEIAEPKEVIAERLQKLWEEGDNMHHYGQIQSMADKLCIKLSGSFGSKRGKK